MQYEVVVTHGATTGYAQCHLEKEHSAPNFPKQLREWEFNKSQIH